MYAIQSDYEIPSYPLEQPNDGKSNLISIVEVNGQADRQKAVFLAPHRKDYYLFVYVKQGKGRHWVDMTPYTIKPHTFYFTVPEQIHLKEEADPLIGTIIRFTAEFLTIHDNRQLRKLPVIQNPHNGHELVLNAADVQFIEDLLSKLVEEYQQNGEWQNDMLFAYLRVLLIYLSRLYTQQLSNTELFADRQVLKRFQSCVEEKYKALHEVAAYADLLNMTAGHLSYLVKTQSGKTAIEHIHERLILEAKRRLFHTHQSIKEIGFGLGFEDASYFNRFFKRLTAQTPLTYRNTIREMYH